MWFHLAAKFFAIQGLGLATFVLFTKENNFFLCWKQRLCVYGMHDSQKVTFGFQISRKEPLKNIQSLLDRRGDQSGLQEVFFRLQQTMISLILVRQGRFRMHS